MIKKFLKTVIYEFEILIKTEFYAQYFNYFTVFCFRILERAAVLT